MNIWSWYLNKSFMSKMTVGFILGILFGFIFGEGSSVLAPLGKLFLNLLRMVVIPLVVLSLIVAVNHSNPRELGRIGAKVFPFYLIATGISIFVGIAIAQITHPGVGLSLPEGATVTPPKSPKFIDTLINMVPSNIFSALSNGDILAVVFVAIVVGLAILFLRHADNAQQREMGELIYKVIEAGNEVVSKFSWHLAICAYRCHGDYCEYHRKSRYGYRDCSWKIYWYCLYWCYRFASDCLSNHSKIIWR